MPYFVRAGVLSGLEEVTEEFGVALTSLLQSLNMPAGFLDHEEALIEISAAMKILEFAAERCACPHLGLMLGARQATSYMGVVGLLAQSAPTIEIAIRETIQHLNLHVQGVYWTLEKHGESAIVKMSVAGDLGDVPKQGLDLSLAQSNNLWRLLTNKKLRATEVHFHYDIPDERWIYRQVFGTQVRFNSEFDGLVFPAKDLCKPMPAKNDYLHNTLSRYVSEIKAVDPTDLEAQVRLVIRHLLPSGRCSIINAAKFFNCDKRTLQRRLKREGVVYNQLVDEERYSQAFSFLKDSRVPLTTIAEMVGFADISTFSRSFKQHVGVAPSEWRKQQGA